MMNVPLAKHVEIELVSILVLSITLAVQVLNVLSIVIELCANVHLVSQEIHTAAVYLSKEENVKWTEIVQTIELASITNA